MSEVKQPMSVQTKELVYRYCVICDHDKNTLLRKFPQLQCTRESSLEDLLIHISECNCENEFLEELRKLNGPTATRR